MSIERYNKLIGLAVGIILATIVGAWGEATTVYRVLLVILFGLLSFAAWSKPIRVKIKP